MRKKGVMISKMISLQIRLISSALSYPTAPIPVFKTRKAKHRTKCASRMLCATPSFRKPYEPSPCRSMLTVRHFHSTNVYSASATLLHLGNSSFWSVFYDIPLCRNFVFCLLL